MTVSAGADDRSDAKHAQERRDLRFIGLVGSEVFSQVNRSIIRAKSSNLDLDNQDQSSQKMPGSEKNVFAKTDKN